MGKRKTKSVKTYNTKTVTVTTSIVPAIKDVKTDYNQGIILINQKTIQDIFTNSGAAAKSNEFQTHYWAVNYRHKAQDGSILDIMIPTVYFNYEQEVTSAHIDFDLKGVAEISAKLEPVHNMMVNSLNNLGFKDQLEKVLGVPVEDWNVPMNSIHRHPGSSRSQSFSGTDLCKTATEPGVCYPLAKPVDTQPNFAGIMAIDSGTCNVAHYEYRIASGELGKDIEYTKGRCAALVVKPNKPLSIIEQIMGVTEVSQSYSKLDNCTLTDTIQKIYELAYDLYINSEFEAFTKAVIAEHVKEKRVAVNTTAYGYNYTGTNYTNERIKKYKHKYISPALLKGKTLYQLNEIFKGLVYIDTGKFTSEYLTPLTTATAKIEEYQKKLGYTAQNIFGDYKYQFLTRKEVVDYTTFELRTEYEFMTHYFDGKEDYSATMKPKSELEHMYESYRKKHGSDIDKLSDSVRAQLKIHQETIEMYKDVELLDLDNKTYTIEQLATTLQELESAYYGDLNQQWKTPLVELKLKTLEELTLEVKDIQSYIQDDINEANTAILNILNSSKTEEKTETKSKAVSPDIEQMKDEMIQLGAISGLLELMPESKIIETYNKFFD